MQQGKPTSVQHPSVQGQEKVSRMDIRFLLPACDRNGHICLCPISHQVSPGPLHIVYKNIY